MKQLLLIVIVLITVSIGVFSQGIIRGKITDENGETVIGALLKIKLIPTIGTVTDFDGNFSLKLIDANPQILIISYMGYNNIEDTINPKNNEILIKDYTLTVASNEKEEVNIVAKAIRAKEGYMQMVKLNSAVTLDYISSETIKKTGDANVSTAVARVSGVSTNGGFITVRGIGDRYVKTTINGMRIPTLDPFTNNIKLDMFPASLVDNVIIKKTASPDLPGDWAGAYISVETKEYPDKLSLNVETAFGYNSQTSFKDIITSQNQPNSYLLGYDSRSYNHSNFTNFNITPSPYLVISMSSPDVLSYLNSLGVNSTNWNDTYYKLALVKFGLLAPAIALGTDQAAKDAFKAADLQFHQKYDQQVINAISLKADKTLKSFPNNWNTTTKKAPLDFTQSFSIGNQNTLFGKPLGYLLGFRYGSSTQYDPQGSSIRLKSGDDQIVESKKNQQISKETNGWSALLDLAYKFNTNNSISLLYMPNMTGVNNVKFGSETINGSSSNISQFYESRSQMVYQVKSEHFIPTRKIKIETNASYTNGKSFVPDFRVFNGSGVDNIYQIDPTNQLIERFNRYLTEDLFDSRISAELPISAKPDLLRKLKFGGAYQYNSRKTDQDSYSVAAYDTKTTPSISGTIDQLLGYDNFTPNPVTNAVAWKYIYDENPRNHTFGISSVIAGFMMLDYTLIPSLRVSGGLRVEQANIFSDVVDFYNNGYPVNDVRRYDIHVGSYANPGKLNELSYLPSASLIYKFRNSETNPINLRANFSQTVARPSLRELSSVSVFDYELQTNVKGNDTLKSAKIYNYDLRLESYFQSGDNISISAFYKDFKNHIELEYSDTYYWQNVDKSYVVGLEFEGRKRITKNLDLKGNFTFVKSESSFIRTRSENGILIYEDKVNRPMFGQSPYIINMILAYTTDSLGLTIALSYNIQGPRLVLGSDLPSNHDVYELNRNSLDLKVTKKLGKHFATSLTVRNVLNAPITRAYLDNNGKYFDSFGTKTISNYDVYKYGTNYILALSYKF